MTPRRSLTILSVATINGQLDSTLSQFSLFSGTASGVVTRSLTASLASVNTTVTASVPEPASLMLLAAPMVGLAFARRR